LEAWWTRDSRHLWWYKESCDFRGFLQIAEGERFSPLIPTDESRLRRDSASRSVGIRTRNWAGLVNNIKWRRNTAELDDGVLSAAVLFNFWRS